LKRAARLSLAALLVAVLAACSSSPSKPRPAELPPAASLIGTQQVWTAQVGAVPATVSPRAVRDRLFVVGAAGNAVLALDTESRREVWRAALSSPVTAGVGSDGDTVAVVTQENELVAIAAGDVRWRQRLAASTYTAPLVAGRRVFVLTADRTVQAFDAETGRRLWSQSRSGEPLVLSQPGVLLAVGDTLVVGQAGRLAGLNPLNGGARWETPIATARGTNEVERLADLLGPALRLGDKVCARAFQNAVGCADASRGALLWSRNAGGTQAVGGSEEIVVGADGADRITAWKTTTGDVLWTNEKFLHRGFSGGVAIGPVVVFGDREGFVHFLSTTTGEPQLRLPTDGQPVIGTPVVSGQTLIVTTAAGGLFAFRPN